MPDDCVVALSARAETDELKVGDGDANSIRANGLVAGGGLVGEVDIRTRDF